MKAIYDHNGRVVGLSGGGSIAAWEYAVIFMLAVWVLLKVAAAIIRSA